MTVTHTQYTSGFKGEVYQHDCHTHTHSTHQVLKVRSISITVTHTQYTSGFKGKVYQHDCHTHIVHIRF